MVIIFTRANTGLRLTTLCLPWWHDDISEHNTNFIRAERAPRGDFNAVAPGVAGSAPIHLFLGQLSLRDPVATLHVGTFEGTGLSRGLHQNREHSYGERKLFHYNK